MTVDELVSWLKKNNVNFFHFTDSRNLPFIRERGLLSAQALNTMGISATFGGNDWSIEADKRCGMDRFVHLCFRRQHPMAYIAMQEKRILEARFLKIDPAVLLLNAKVCDGVSNKAGTVPGEPVATFHNLDLEVLYSRTDWRDPLVKERLRKAEKYEIIVPDEVPLAYIRNLDG